MPNPSLFFKVINGTQLFKLEDTGAGHGTIEWLKDTLAKCGFERIADPQVLWEFCCQFSEKWNGGYVVTEHEADIYSSRNSSCDTAAIVDCMVQASTKGKAICEEESPIDFRIVWGAVIALIVVFLALSCCAAKDSDKSKVLDKSKDLGESDESDESDEPGELGDCFFIPIHEEVELMEAEMLPGSF